MRMEKGGWQNIYDYDQLEKMSFAVGYAHVLNNQKIFASDGVRSKSSLC